MKNTYSQLSSEERDQIAILRAQGKSLSDIAKIIRRFLPKKTDFSIITHQQIKRIEILLNNRLENVLITILL